MGNDLMLLLWAIDLWYGYGFREGFLYLWAMA